MPTKLLIHKMSKCSFRQRRTKKKPCCKFHFSHLLVELLPVHMILEREFQSLPEKENGDFRERLLNLHESQSRSPEANHPNEREI